MRRLTRSSQILASLVLLLISLPAHAEGGLPQLNTSSFPSQIFWLLISFALMYLGLSKFALKPMASVKDDRTAKINTDLDKAATNKAEADKLVADYEQKLANAHNIAKAEVNKVVDAAKADAAKAEATQMEALSAETAKAEARIATARAKAMTELTAEAHELTRLLSQKIAGLSPKPDAISRAVAEAADTHSPNAEAA